MDARKRISEVLWAGMGGGLLNAWMHMYSCVYPLCTGRSDRDSPEVRQGAAEGIFSDGDGH